MLTQEKWRQFEAFVSDRTINWRIAEGKGGKGGETMLVEGKQDDGKTNSVVSAR